MPPRLQTRWALPKLPITHLAPCPFSKASRQQVRTIKSIRKKVPPTSRFNTAYQPLQASKAVALERRILADTLPLRTGALAIKKGMSAIYDPDTGKRTPCTVLQMDQVQVVGHKTRQKNGYWAVKIGYGSQLARRLTKAELGAYAKATYTDANGGEVGVSPKKEIREFRVRDASGLLEIGQIVQPSWFQEGQFIDARAKSRGHGFTGGMKRWGFGGQPASHGVSLTHRSMGSAGGSQGSGSRVHPGKKMAGRMGGQRHTVQNLKVLKVDDANGLVVVHGVVSGPKNGLVQIQDALLKPWPKVASTPTPSAPEDAAEPLKETA